MAVTATAATAGSSGSTAPRTRAVDALRGAVMVVMALDHVRDFLGDAHYDATDLAVTTAPVFWSRWITHFCAPTFFLLAGASAALSIASGRRTPGAAARFLVGRGLALVVLEQTALRCLGWYFHFDYHFMNAGVLYGLGLAMVLLAACVRLPPVACLGLGLAIVLGEGAIASLELGDGWLGTALALATRSRDFEPVTGYHFFVSYPPVPWFGAMVLGYGLAGLVWAGGRARAGLLAGQGVALLAVFAVVRALGLGDPSPWGAQPDTWRTVAAAVNVSKYPPSTAFLLLTLGAALLGLAAFERWPRAGRPLEGFGRAPLFFYVVHIPLIHLAAVVYSWAAFGDASWLTSGPVIFWDTPLPGSPASYGFGLVGVYLAWAAVIAALYPACRWYTARARRGRGSVAA